MIVVLHLSPRKVAKNDYKLLAWFYNQKHRLQIKTMTCVCCVCTVFLFQSIVNLRKNFKQGFVCLRCNYHVSHFFKKKEHKNTICVQRRQNRINKSKKKRKTSTYSKSFKHKKKAKKVKKKYLPQNILDDINWMIACYKSTL